MSGAEERAKHPEGAAFQKYFNHLLLNCAKSCFERDILRDTKEAQWQAWKQRAYEWEEAQTNLFKDAVDINDPTPITELIHE